MTLNSAELQFAGNGEVYVAPVGTAMPPDEDTALNAAFIGLGYTTEDGVTVTPSAEMTETRGWQSAYVLDRRVSTRDLQMSFTLLQVNKETFKLMFGGGSWVTATGTHTFTPPSPETIDYRAVVLHLVDGAELTRILVPKVLVSEPGAIQIRRNEPSAVAMTLGMVATGVGNPYTVVSNAARFATV